MVDNDSLYRFYEIVSSNKFRFGNLRTSVHLFRKESLFRNLFGEYWEYSGSNLGVEAHSELEVTQ
jgi:hypothetical protein